VIKIASSKKSRRKKAKKHKQNKLRKEMRHREQEEVSKTTKGFFNEHLKGISEEWVEPNKTEPAGTKYRTFYSETIKSEVSYLIYFPFVNWKPFPNHPDYDTAEGKLYPVVYWLHGLNGNQRRGAKFVEKLDAAIKSGNAPPMIAVLVNGLSSSMYCDSADGMKPVESIIVKDLIPYMDKTYPTIAKREGRAVEGFSMGGFGAAHLGFKYPELFGAVSIMSGALHDADSIAQQRQEIFQNIFGGNREYFQSNSPWILAEKNADVIRCKVTVRIIVGGEDRLLQRNRDYHKLLSHLEIPHQFEVAEEVGHNARMLYENLGDMAFSFYSKTFKTILEE